MKKGDKRGQFYILTAIIFVVIIMGFSVVSNYSKKKDYVRLYDIREELGIESGKVIDYGTYNELNENEMSNLVSDFATKYSEYAGEGRNLYFVYGNKNKVNVLSYEEMTFGKLTIDMGKRSRSSRETGGKEFKKEEEEFPEKEKGEHRSDKVDVELGGKKYEFELKSGENFYFIVSQEIDGEKYVVGNN